MKKYNFSKLDIKAFIKKHGFKTAVALSVIGLGISAYTAINGIGDIEKIENNGASNLPVENVVSGITDDRPTSKNNTSSLVSDSESAISSDQSENLQSDDPSSESFESTESGISEETLAYPEYFFLPVNGVVTNEFSDNELVFSKTMGDWRAHNGVDLKAITGERVIATANGVVTAVYGDEAWGYTVEIDHGGSLTAKYRNLDENVLVNINDKVAAGQTIGSVGRGGYEESAEGPHLHLEMTYHGKYVDPITVMNKKSA